MYLVNCATGSDCWQQLIVNVRVIHAHLTMVHYWKKKHLQFFSNMWYETSCREKKLETFIGDRNKSTCEEALINLRRCRINADRSTKTSQDSTVRQFKQSSTSITHPACLKRSVLCPSHSVKRPKERKYEAFLFYISFSSVVTRLLLSWPGFCVCPHAVMICFLSWLWLQVVSHAFTRADG